MISLMGNCMSWVKKRQEPRRKLTLVMIGLDNAGKTVTAQGLSGEPVEDTTPTVGFQSADFAFEKFDVTMFDLGGGKKIRGIWKNYFAESYGVVFLIDSSDEDRLEECRDILTEVLRDEKVSGKPVLILANKQDVEGCYTEAELLEYMSIEEIVNVNKCPCRMETCSAVMGTGKKIDPSIKQGMSWLLNTIDLSYEKYNGRIETDMAIKKEKEAKELAERRERVRKVREERDRLEEEERLKNGEPEKPDSDDEDIMDSGDPFKTVDAKELEAKQAKAKEEKKKKKQAKLKKEAEESPKDEENEEPKQNDNDSNNKNNSASHNGLRRQRSNLSEEEDENEVISPRSKKGPKYNGSPRPLDAMPLQPSRRLAPLNPVSQLEPLDAGDGEGKKKKKKKKVKRNKTAPIEDDETGETNFSKAALPPLKSSPPAQRNFMARTASKRPGLASVEDESNFNQKWNLAEDLPEEPETQRSKPNVDSDNDIMM